VSLEQGEPPSAVEASNGLVGYSVRLDSHIGPKTRLAYVTYGIALKMLENRSVGGQAGTAFDEITHVIIDEVSVTY
jgi:ATP-dependent RNA helicase DHX29